MHKRAVAAVAVAILMLAGAGAGARAQQPANGGSPASQTGWVFNVAPYLWLPSINTALSYKLPANLGGRLPTDVSDGPGNYLSHLDFAAAFAADARNGPFSLLTDFMYTRFSASGSRSRIQSVDFDGRPRLPISGASQLHVGSTLGMAIWTLAGGYTVL